MAQKTTVLLIDDVDGGEADETVTFALDGVSYEIDVSEKNAQSLRDALAPWLGHARRVTGRGGSGGGGGDQGRGRRASSSGSASRTPGRSASGHDLGAVRAWARENGHEVSDRGRVSSKVMSAYDEAHA